VDQFLLRAREQLMLGASQLKLAAGGRVASNYDRLMRVNTPKRSFVPQSTPRKTGALMSSVHAYAPRAIQTAIHGGVKCIEHGQLMDEATAKLMAEKGIWLSIQPFVDDQDANAYPEGPANRAKQVEFYKGTDNAYALAKKYKLKTAWGTDILFERKRAARQGAMLA
jgi:imidazolonepropionase-like amidohydrolase